jgi:hypothetical protein
MTSVDRNKNTPTPGSERGDPRPARKTAPPKTAADYVDRYDEHMTVVLGDLIEHANEVLAWWVAGREQVRTDPELALRTLVDAEINLSVYLRIERVEALRHIRAATNRLDAELPDDDDHSSDGS